LKTLLLLLALSVGTFGQSFIDAPDELPQNFAAVGAAVGPTRADGAGWGAYAHLLNRASGTYSISGIAVVPALAPALNGHHQIVLTSTVFSGVEQVIAKYKRVMVAIDAGLGAALPSSGTPAFNFSGTYAGTLVIRTSKDPKQGAGHIVFGMRFSQTPLGIVPTLYAGHGWSW